MLEKYSIDLMKLTRNYLEFPLKRGEIPNKEDLQYLYLDLNIGKKDMCQFLGNISSSRFQRIIKQYGIKKSIEQLEELAKASLGASSPFCFKESHIKAQQTKIIKYGDKNYNNSSKNKITSLEKYGVSNPSKQHISQHILDIIDDKDKMVSYINTHKFHNILEMVNNLGIGYKTIQRRIQQWNLYQLFNYSVSLPEKEIRDYINQHFETENNVKKYLDGKEIDVYIPKKNIGIEFNGNFWHNEYGKDKNYHQDKSVLAESKGIFLYHIFEYEWNTKKDQIVNQLNNLLGLNQTKIYARKCEIKEIDNIEKKQFLELNHMQGDDVSSIKLGLYHNNELVSLMTFVKPRFNKKYQWELSRFCSKAGSNVIGGASKLFKYFINNYKPVSIISYSNIAHTRGNLYKTLGMTLQGISEPNYVWCNHNNILTRYQCQKHKLLEQGFNGESEVDIMHTRDYYRIYDCGNKVWVWNNK